MSLLAFNNMLKPLNHVAKKYKMLIAKMVIDFGLVEPTKANLLNLCDIDMILGLRCVLLMTKSINALMSLCKEKMYLYMITL
jgi:hypothetical protein